MKSRLRWMLITLLLLGVIPTSAFARPAWQVVKTDHFTVFYPPELERSAFAALQTLEHFRPFVEALVGNEDYHLPVVIEDTGSANGFTNPVFRRVNLWATPSAPRSTLASAPNWWSTVAPHEYIHHLSLSRVGGEVRQFRTVLGSLALPNLYAPGWVIEGITVFGESQLSPYQGRLNDGYFDAYLGACVQEDRLPSIAEATHQTLRFPSGDHYLYGGEFFNYLALTYGPEKFAAFFAANGSSLASLLSFAVPAFGLDQAAKQVYGRPFPKLWAEWQDHERKRFKDYRMDGERLTRHGWFVGNPVIQGRRLYYTRSYSLEAGSRTYLPSELRERDLDSGRERIVLQTTAGFSLPLRVHGTKLYYGVEELGRGYANAAQAGYGTLAVLRELDLETGVDRAVLSGRLRAYEVLPGGAVLYARDRRDAFGSELRRYDPATGDDQPVAPLDCLIEEMVTDGERLVASARRDWENAGLFLLSPSTGDLAPLIDTPAVEYGLSLNGERLFYTSNYGRVYTAYAYDLASGRNYRLTTGGYAAEPAYDPERDQLYFIGLTADGFDLYCKPATLSAECPLTNLASTPAPRPRFTLEESRVTRGDYRDNLRTLAPVIHLPILEPDDRGGVAAGVVLVGEDSLRDFSYQTSLLYHPALAELDYDVDVTCRYWAPWMTQLELANGDGVPRAAVDLAYPLLRRLSPGLSGLTAALSTSYAPRSGEWETAPTLTADFAYPRALGSVAVKAPLRERGSGVSVGLGTACAALGGDLAFRAYYANDQMNPEAPLRQLRGFSAPLPAKEGYTGTAEYSRILWRIHKGLWSPSLFLDAVTGTLFVDAALAGDGERQSSYGGELHLAGKAVGLGFDAAVRLVRNSEGTAVVQYSVKAELLLF